MKFDFHVHTNVSPCAVMKPKLAVKIAKKRGLDAIAIVNHNKLIKFNPKGFKVILGEEIKTKQGEVIGLFLKKEIKKGLDAQKTIDQIKAQGGIVMLPHVFDPFRKSLGNHVFKLKNIDFIELNGRCVRKKFNKKVLQFSKQYGIPVIGGSDAHYYDEIGHIITEVKATTIKDAIKKLKNNQGKIIKENIGFKKYKCIVKSAILSAVRKTLKY